MTVNFSLKRYIKATWGTMSRIALLGYTVLSVLCFAADLPAQDRSAVRVGMLLPLSGSYASVGEDNRRGVEMALAEGGQMQLVPVYGDSRADPTQSINEFIKLVTVDHVAAVFAFRGPVGMAVSPLAEQHKIPLLGGVGNKDFTGGTSFAFQVWPRSDEEGAFLAEQLVKAGHRRVALWTTEDDWTVAVSDGIRAAGEELSLVMDQSVLPSVSDFRTIAIQTKEKRPDAIVVNLGIAQIGPAVRQLRQLKIDALIYSNFFAGKPEVINAAGKEA